MSRGRRRVGLAERRALQLDGRRAALGGCRRRQRGQRRVRSLGRGGHGTGNRLPAAVHRRRSSVPRALDIGSPNAIQIVRLISVHAKKVFFDVVGPIELLLAQIAVEWFFVAVNIFMAREEIPAVGRVRARGAGVALPAVAAALGLRRDRLADDRARHHCAGGGASFGARGLYLMLIKSMFVLNVLISNYMYI